MYRRLIHTFIVAVSLCCATFTVQAETQKQIISESVSSSSEVLRDEWQAKASSMEFVDSQRHRYPSWQTAQISTISGLYDLNNQLQAYEVQLQDTFDQPVGYLILEASFERAKVAEFSVKGEAPSVDLIKELESNTENNFNSASDTYQLLWNGPGTSGLTWKSSQKEGRFITLNPTVQADDYLITRSKKPISSQTQEKQSFSRARSSMMQEVQSEAIHWSFTPFYQEFRTWSNSGNDRHECYAGCTPVAAAMLIDFYDRNGFPFMIGDDTQQVHYASSPLMRDTIDQLRGYLGTYCSSDGQGGTSQSSSVKLVDYMNTRGTQQWGARRISYATLSTFFYLMREIKAQRPVIVHYHTRGQVGSNHSAIAYGYIYGGYWSDNFLTVRTGWSRQEEIQYNIESMGTIGATIVTQK